MEALLDYVALLAAASADRKMRARAESMLAMTLAAERPLSASHGDHVLRPSSFGRCSLEFAADAHGWLDLPDVPRDQMVLDSGTLHGAWFAALLVASLPGDHSARLEIPYEYRGVRGSADVTVYYSPAGSGIENAETREIIEIKTTPSSGALKPPDAAKPYQCLQASCYALDERYPCDRFSVLTYGANVGNNRDGVPHPKMRCDTYATADWKPLVDAEIDRLSALASMSTAEVLANAATLADTTDAFRCRSCRYSACERNLNPAARFAL